MSAPDSLVRVSPASDLSELFDTDEGDGESQRAGSDTTSDRTDADTAAEQNDPPDTLVVHAPGFGIESVINEVESAVDEVCESAVVRVGEDPDDNPATGESVVFTDLYARYGDRETTVWSRLRDRLDAPEATVAAFVEPYELDWLCRGSASGEASPLSGFDRVVHLRYDADGTTGDRDGDVGEAVATATDLVDEDADPKAVRATLSAYRYSHEYEHASGALADETFGPALVPEVVADLPLEAWPANDSDVMERVRDRISSLGSAAGYKRGVENAKSALSEIVSPTTVTTVVVDAALTGGAATALGLALQHAGDDDPAAVELLDDASLPPTMCAEFDAELDEAPGTVALALEFSQPDRMARVVEIARDGGDLDQIETALAEQGQQVDDIEVRLTRLETRLPAQRDPDTTGFDQVTREKFEDGSVDDEQCWRRAFKLAEAWAGYPLDRERPLRDGGRRRLTEELMNALADGGGAALLGAPGSGKTTATRTAMADWARQHDDGTVFYRRKATTVPLDTERLEAAIRTAREDGPVLVVVEDAARRGTYPLYETVREFGSDDGVSFLVNSRESEWRDSEREFRDVYGDSQAFDDARTVQSEAFTPVDMPPLDAREVERFLDNYTEVTGDEMSLDGDTESVLSQIRGYEGASPMLLLAYYLPVWRTEISTDGDMPALIENVREVFGFARGESKRAPELTADEQEVTERVALAVNVLNAAEAPVRKEFLLAVGGGDEFDAVTSAWHSLTGPLLFNVQKGDPEFSTHHPLWSELYLSHHLEECGARDATDVFESVVNDLFGVIDDEALREAIRRELRKDTRLLKLIERKPKAFTRQLVVGVFGIGEDRPEIHPLYGTSPYSGIELPSAGGERVAVEAAFRRATMFNSRGKSTREREELDWAWKRAVEAGIDDGLIAGKYHTRRGHYASQQGEFETAREHYEQAREAAPGDEESQHEATSLNNLGLVARNLGEYERAREYHEESLEIEQEIGNRAGEASSLNNLGSVAQSIGEYERARQRHQESLEIFREIGDRAREATSLGNLGSVARNLGEYERAREYHEESLEIKQEIGNRAGEASSLNNLGSVAQSLGEYERAREYHEESLEINQEIGDRAGEATSLNNLGSVAGEQEDYETAERRHREALAISEELGDRSGVANQQYNVGVDAERQGDLERALEWFQKSRATYADLGVDHRVVRCLESISRIAARLGHTETASEACTDAIELIERSDLDHLAEQAREFRVRLARLDETPQGTLELYSHALGHVLEGEVGTATRLSRETWARRDTHDEDGPAFAVTLAAGVGFAAHLTLAAAADGIDPDDDETPDPDDVLAEIDPTELPTEATSLYHALTRGVPSITPATLREQADEIDPDGSGEQIEILERRAYAELIEALSAGASDKTATDRYKQSLFQIAGDGDSDTVVDTLASLWDERDDHDPGSDAYAAATAAGLLLAGYDSGGEAGAPVDAETVVQRVDPAATPLSDAVRAVYDHLAGDDPDHTPEELHERIDPPFSDPEVEQLETAVFASALAGLAGDDPDPEELYRRAFLEALGEDTDLELLVELFERVWKRRDEVDAGADDPVVAAAGVALAGHLELLPETTEADDERIDEILSSVDPASTSLSDAVRAVYDHLAGDDPDHTAEELHDRVDSLSADGELDQLETVVFASLLSAFTSEDLADYSTTELYRRALVEALDEDRDVGWMMDLLQRVWERRDDHDSSTDAHAAATAAGILAGVFATGADDTALFVDAETVVQRVDPAATPLSDAARTAYDHLAGDEPGHTVEELRDQIDPPFSDPAVEQLETAVFATVLSAFTNDDTVPTVERYRDTLTDIARGDTNTQTALTELHRVWTQRDDHEPDTDAHAAAAAAGVALAAYAELVPDQTDAVVDDPDALPPRGPSDSSRTTLPDAVRAVCDHLAVDDPDHTATELKARVDTDTPSGTDAETVVFARLLAALS